jgi:hypothetical protein
MLLRTAGENITQHTISCLRRRTTNKGNHFDISLDDEYVDNTFHQMMVKKWNRATTTGATIGKTNIEDEQLLNQQERQLFRVGTHQARHQLRNKRNLKRDEGFQPVCVGLRLCRKGAFTLFKNIF